MLNEPPILTTLGISTDYSSSKSLTTLLNRSSDFSLPQTTVDYINHKADKWKAKLIKDAKKEAERNAFNLDKLVTEAKKRLKNHINEITYRHLSEHFKLFPRNGTLTAVIGASGSGGHGPKLGLFRGPNTVVVTMMGGGGGGTGNGV